MAETGIFDSWYVHLPGVLTTSEIASLRRVIAGLAGGTFGDGIHFWERAVCLVPEVCILVVSRDPLRSVVQVLGVHCKLLGSEIWIREPSAPQLGWHRDGGPLMRHIRANLQVKVQLFLTDSHEAGANVRFVPGSHTRELPPAGIAPLTDFHELVVKAGDAAVWCGNTWHSVSANNTHTPRISVILTYGSLWLEAIDASAKAPTEGVSELHHMLLTGRLSQAPVRRADRYYPTDTDERRAIMESQLGTLANLPLSDTSPYAK
jgi:ectoine hydroxylase-related dioxygenase (phytanoyl-CoA dioxygenase family)